MPDGGDLTVSAENLTIGETETVPLDPGDYVRISVRDQGIGIPEKYLARLFDPFFTTKQKGSGLGLAVTYSIIKRHDGHITVESQLGRGTTFALYLPANRLAEFTLAPEPTAYQGRGSLLVVDDDVIVCEAVQAMLSYLGFTVTLAYNGDSALAAFQASRATGHPFTAVMLDLTLPGGMNGETIAKRLLELDSAIPIIISSGYADNPMMAHYAAYGCRAAIAKPYSLAELRDVLKATLGEPVAG